METRIFFFFKLRKILEEVKRKTKESKVWGKLRPKIEENKSLTTKKRAEIEGYSLTSIVEADMEKVIWIYLGQLSDHVGYSEKQERSLDEGYISRLMMGYCIVKSLREKLA